MVYLSGILILYLFNVPYYQLYGQLLLNCDLAPFTIYVGHGIQRLEIIYNAPDTKKGKVCRIFQESAMLREKSHYY